MKRFLAVPLAACVALAAGCAEGGPGGITAPVEGTVLSSGESDNGVEPRLIEGNIPGEGLAVCADPRVNPGGAAWLGFKIDPPASGSFAGIAYTLSADGKYLGWSSSGATVHAVLVKGGPDSHLYAYNPPAATADQGLHSPLNSGGQVPEISHFVFCYTTGRTGDGCTPGYWRNHTDRWAGVAPTATFDATFGVASGLGAGYTLGEAIEAQGGGIYALARHATAALLNAYGGVPNADGTTVDYPYTAAEVIDMVQAAFANGTIEATKDLLAAANELGCPLSATRATKGRR
jgi:hypothetical protein